MNLEIKKNIPLAPFTTFKIGGKAKYFIQAKTSQEAIGAVQWAKEKRLPFFILGGGSNLLVSDKGFDGCIIKMENAKIKMWDDNEKYKIIEAGAELKSLIDFSLQQGLTGLEWASGIPGITLGGAIRGNAGAFGKNIGDVIKEVEAVRVGQNSKIKIQNNKPKLEIIKFNKAECKFGYKDSIFKRNKDLIILSAILGLEKNSKEDVNNEVKKVLEYRRRYHPVLPSAGCVFINAKCINQNVKLEKIAGEFPEIKEFVKRGEISAGWLIGKAGLSGKKIGKSQISKEHSNFIVNLGGAKSKDVLTLINLIKLEVKKKFGIILKEEIQYLGF